MGKDQINILIGSDIKYAPYYGVMLTSLFENNKESQFDIYLLTDNSWTKKATKKFEKLCANHNSRFFMRVIDDETMKVCPLNPHNHISRSTYYRLMAATLLPDTIDKILYLDGDMVVRGEIRDLWNYDLHGKAIAGVADSLHYDDETYSRLGFDKKYGYFNAGVELINLKYWREKQVSRLAISFIESHQDNLPLMDQDTINAVLADVKAFLPICYNFQTMYLTKYFSKNFTPAFMEDVLANSKHPVIIHYNGGIKPWHWRYYGLPYQKEWDAAYKASPWHHARIQRPWGKHLKNLVKRATNKQSYLNDCREQYIMEVLHL